MDATKIKVGDTIHLRNGDVKTVTDVEHRDDATFPVYVCWNSDCETYTPECNVWVTAADEGEAKYDPLDILEIIPAETSEKSLEEDIVVKPAHYTQFEIEPITFIMKNRLTFEIGNIIKYACRAGSKIYPDQDYRASRITDLQKVQRYAEMEINRLKGGDIL